ncbi:FecR domain-containing protein [uncultured Bacteroides sp.]|uniref:FecR family protein n=1 Tax=uncultured Bacteroides sp. TaxID=162156 RepID=UPI00261F7512|nr:FecR domain-containing protein [uncultured Bacteroides sp.]
MNDPFDNLLDRLARSTRSPRGRYSAENSWKILEERVFLKAHRRRRLYRWLGGAAAAVLLFVAGWTAYEALRPVPTQTFSTLAEVRSLTLPDGTEVTLNRYSSLTCPERFRRDRRDVSLQGEACFRVSKDARRPFTVEAGGMEVRVLGTHFNVEAYPADTEARTTLLEGSVAVSAGGGKERLILRPNEAAVYNRRTGSLRQEACPAAGDEIAWSQGVFLFRRQTLQEIARQLSNAFRTPVRIESAQLAAYRLTATFGSNESLTEILDVLQEAGRFGYRDEGGTIVISPRQTE